MSASRAARAFVLSAFALSALHGCGRGAGVPPEGRAGPPTSCWSRSTPCGPTGWGATGTAPPTPRPRRPGQARRALCRRGRPRPAHGALARLDPDRAHSPRTRRPRQRRLRAAGDRTQRGRGLPEGRLSDGRLRVGLPAEAPLRLRARLRRLRRPAAARQGPAAHGLRGADRGPDHRRRAALARHGRLADRVAVAILPVGALLRSPRALRGARRGDGGERPRRTTARSRSWTPSSDGCSVASRRASREPRLLVLVTADHGESLGEHGEDTHGIFLYDSTIRVPFILAGAGVSGGRVADTVGARHRRRADAARLRRPRRPRGCRGARCAARPPASAWPTSRRTPSRSTRSSSTAGRRCTRGGRRSTS